MVTDSRVTSAELIEADSGRGNPRKSTLLPQFGLYQHLFSGCIMLAMLFLVACHSAVIPPRAEGGVLDLQSWDFDSQGPVQLSGEWQFFWQQLRQPTDFASPNFDESQFILLPVSWNVQADGEPLSSYGYMTCRLQVLLSHPNQKLALDMPNVETAYRLYINGRLVTEVGTVSDRAETASPYWLPQVVEVTSDDTTLDIVLHVSNYHYRWGGAARPINLGTEAQIRATREWRVVLSIFLSGSILIMSLYHFGLFALRSKHKAPLYFGVFCLCMMIWTLTSNDTYLVYLIPGINWELVLKLIYLSTYLVVPAFAMFLHSLYNDAFSIVVLRLIQGVGFILSMIVLLTPARVFAYTVDINQLSIILSSLYSISVLIRVRHREGAKIFLLAFLLLFATAINDILQARQLISTGYYASLGVFIFIFAQSFLISALFSKAFTQIEVLSATLEQRVAERTQQLEATQSELIQSEKMAALGQLVAGVAHEINNPLGAIQASVGNISRTLDETTDDLIKLSQLLSHDHQLIFLAMIKQATVTENNFSVKEQRQLRRKITRFLEANDIEDSYHLADMLCDMGLHSQLTPFLPLLKNSYATTTVEVAYKLARQQANSQNIALAVSRVSKIVFALKSYARRDVSGQKTLANIPNTIDTVLTIYQNDLKQTVEVIRLYDDELPDMLCYPDELSQIWTNLIHNALQAMEYQGELTIKVTRCPAPSNQVVPRPSLPKPSPAGSPYDFMRFGRRYANLTPPSVEEHAEPPVSSVSGNGVRQLGISVTVTDNGPGVPDNIKARIFEPFFTTKPAGEGSGLGLDIVRRIVEKHAGSIQLESQPGRTTFEIWLPLETDDNNDDETTSHNTAR